MKNVVMILMGLSAAPAMAVLSGETGHIHGRAPTATGALQAVFPDGSTIVTEGIAVGWNQIPEQFSLMSQGLIPEDLDGDIGLNIVTDTTQANLTWYNNGIPFTDEQMKSTFGYNFGQSDELTLELSAPVTVSSATGVPATTGPIMHTSRYSLRGPIFTPVFDANLQMYAPDSGFPTTGFINARFRVLINGASIAANNYFDWEVSESWLSVDANGLITFERKPNDSESRTVRVQATHKNNGEIWAWSFTVDTWFTGYSNQRLTWASAGTFCHTQGQRLPEKEDLSNGTNIRGIGALFSEWGSLNGYIDSGYMSTLVGNWTSTPYNDGYYLVSLSNGALSYNPSTSSGGIVCKDDN